MRRLPVLRACVLALIVVSVLMPATAQTDVEPGDRHSRIVVHPRTERDIEMLRSLDVDHMYGGADGITVVATHADVERLRSAGVDVDVEVAELELFYEQRALRDMETLRAKESGSVHGLRNFTLGSVGGYYSVAELRTQLERMVELYPQLAGALEVIGTTHEGRPILAVRLSARPASDETLPSTMFNALHHPREPAGMMSLVYTMWALLEGYGTDPEITYLLDNRSLWFIPMVNPDGYERNATRFPNGGGLWRKNMRAGGEEAVDLNRNYGPQEFWDHAIGGSSTNAISETYRGPEPFSEPETQAIRDFSLRHRFAVALNHHTFSNLLIQPEEILSLEVTDSIYYTAATRAFASLVGFAPGNSKVTVGYTARGTSDDWLYAFGHGDDGHTFSWTPESGNGEDEFWPAPTRIEPICASSHRMNMALAWAAGAAPIITARSWRADPAGAIVRVTVMNVGRAAMTVPATISLDSGDALDVPPLAPSETLTFELRVPEPLRSLPLRPRPMVGITLAYESARIRDSIAPIAHPVAQVFSENFEAGIARWDTSVGWGLESTSGHTRVASDSPGEKYQERREANSLTLREPIALRGFSAAELFFDASYAIEGRNHTAFVQVRREPELEWHDADCEELQLPFESASPIRNRFRGDMREWRRYRVNLDGYLGGDVSVRFVVEAFNSQWHYTFDGIEIDDIEVVAATPIAASAQERDDARALTVSPNPFSSRLLIQFGDGRRGATVELYDALGSLVRAAAIDVRTTIETDGLPDGAYTVLVRTGAEVLRRSVVLIR